MDKTAPQDLKSRLMRWEKLAQFLRSVHVLLAVTAIVCSLLVTSSFTDSPSFPKEMVAFIAALAVGLLSGLDLGGRANRYRRAWRKLRIAIMKFEENLGVSKEELYASYEEAENIIGDLEVKT